MRSLLARTARLLALAMPLLCVGCDQEIKMLVIDQFVGFASAIAAAATTSVIQSLFGSSVAV
ncbi:MAG: hypothetical protein GXY33_16380 [Phycisphaerae bacterium]|nr:hypothetical protein [Phycisphaerae bacterium]